MNRFNFLKTLGLGTIFGLFAAKTSKSNEVVDVNLDALDRQNLAKSMNQPLSYINELYKESEEIASKLMFLPDLERRSELLKIKKENDLKHYIVCQTLQKQKKAYFACLNAHSNKILLVD